MKKKDIAGWISIVIGVLLLTSTFRTQDMDPSVRLKTKAIGGSDVREIGYGHRRILLPAGGILTFAGILLISIEKPKQKK